MGFELMSYQIATGGAVTDLDMSALTDADFSQRNNHYIFTESYRLAASAIFGATVTRANYQPPTWNAIGRYNIWPVVRSVTIPSPPQVDWAIDNPAPVPMMEEFQVKVTDTASETVQHFMWLITDDWTANLPKGRMMIEVRCTATITSVANAWSSLGALTFEQSLRGGVYAVVGAQCQSTNGLAFRLVFPRYKLYKSRKLRPGWLQQNAIGDQEESKIRNNPFLLGEWGRFHTFEPPQLEITATDAASHTCELRLWLVFLTDSPGQTDPYAIAS